MLTIAATLVDGKYAPATAIPADAREVLVTSAEYQVLTADDFAAPTTAAFGAVTWRDSRLLASNLTVPANFFGLHVLGESRYADIPTLGDFGSFRTHDSGCRWDQIELADGVYTWTRLDALVAANAGKQIVYTFYGTPSFHSTDTTDAQNSPYSNGAGGYITRIASNPTAGGLTALDAFITALMTRYSSTIQAIEVWNEPNASTSEHRWWWGTQQELANIIKRVSVAAKAVVPGVVIVSPATVGWVSTGTAKGYTEAVLALTASGDATAVHNRVDAIGCHLYAAESSARGVSALITAVAAAQTTLGTSKPVWDTEVGFLTLSSGGDTTGYTDDGYVRRMFAHLMTCAASGVARSFWYAYDQPSMGYRTRTSAAADIAATVNALADAPLNIYRVGGEVVVERISDGTLWRF